MVTLNSGKDWEGKDCHLYLDDNLHKNFSDIKKVVSKKDFDYVAIVAGLPGLGKSNFAINCCKFFDPNFSIDNIAMSAEEFIDITTKAEPRSAIMLDESFASLNSKISMTSAFLRVVNHLQIVRQKNLYIFLCLPNFFDLQKGVSIYRSSHLFVVYGNKFGERGRFGAWDRDKKKKLYIKGLKYMNYHAEQPNFRGRFYKQHAINQDVYEELKLKHLMQQEKEKFEKKTKYNFQRDILVHHMVKENSMKPKEVGELIDVGQRGIYQIVKRLEDDKQKNKT